MGGLPPTACIPTAWGQVQRNVEQQMHVVPPDMVSFVAVRSAPTMPVRTENTVLVVHVDVIRRRE
jgi:hypothetical protein